MNRENIEKLNLFGNLMGGINASIVSFPKNIAYGALVFAPLGPEFYSFAILSGIISFIFINIVTTFIYGNKIISSGPSSLASIMMASSVTFIINELSEKGQMSINNVLGFFFLLIIMISIIQLMFGLFKVGELTKYIPYPVISGIANGGAILILVSQSRDLLGLDSSFDFSLFYDNIEGFIIKVSFPLLAIGLSICLVLILSKKYLNKIPDTLVGIIFGTIVFYIIQYFFPNIYLGETIGQIPVSFENLSTISRFQFLITPEIFIENIDLSLQLIGPAFSISIVITLNCLLTQSTSDNLLNSFSKSNRELVAQSLGNFISGLFGGFPGNPAFSRTLKSFEGGATNSSSKLFSALFTILVIVILKPILPIIPKICFTAIIIMLAIKRFDKWFFLLFKKIFSGKKYYRKEGISNIIIVLLVILAMFLFGVFEAVGIGILISIIIFVYRMSRTVIRRQLSGIEIRSNVERPVKEIDLLKKEGARIQIIELEGALFFGSTDNVNSLVRELITLNVDYIIVDFKNVNNLDLSAVQVIHNMIKTCKLKNKVLLISSIYENSSFDEILNLQENVFNTLEDAFAWAEDNLLEKYLPELEFIEEIHLSDIDALSRFDEDETNILLNYLEKIEYHKGEIIFKEDDPGDAVYFLVKGRAHIFKNLNGIHKKRISTISRGTIFGEMAVLDGNTRSAGVVSDNGNICYKLCKDQMESLMSQNPNIAIKLISGIGIEISGRMRIVINMNTALKQ